MAGSLSHLLADPAGSHPEDARHILADSSLTAEPIRVLKHGDTFAVFDQYGDIRPGSSKEEGLYHDGTRFLSRLVLELEGTRPFFLSSNIRDDNDQLTVALTNPDLCRKGRVYLPLGSLHIGLKKFLWHGACYQELRIENHGMQPADVGIGIQFAADFADIYEVRGLKRKARGKDLEPEVSNSRVTLRYRGLDSVLRRTILQFTPPPALLDRTQAQFRVSLLPKQSMVVYLAVGCERESGSSPLLHFEQARSAARASLDAQKERFCRIEASNGQFNAWVKRAASDLHMMTTELPSGPYPYAGVPWFNTPFGRDGLITALECLWLQPELALGVLAYLAATQATDSIPEQDAEPGKILHETRNGEMAALGEMPFARYYGSVDATPLFIHLAGAYYERSGDRAFIQQIWPNIEAALRWMHQYGDRDGDGFLEYSRRCPEGLVHQGWKDSDDAIFHADGSLVRGPIAVCEVQGYAYAAWRAGAALASALGYKEQSQEFVNRAETLRARFDSAFWWNEAGTYALALDGDKRPCQVRTSNAGQCLFSGIAFPERAARIGHTLLAAESFSGWGIRSLAASEPRYNPMGYHTGGVWPHDNALIACGLARYGMAEEASRIFTGLFDTAMYLDLHRVPELFCGFPRDPGEGPILYPVACAPQAWSAASVFLLFQSCLGLAIDGVGSKISFVRPWLPPFLTEATILNLQVGDASVDLTVVRHDSDVSVKILHQRGNVEIAVVM
ncbi:MAG TPA: amylo-alpha-1,6-glucosidase [Bryobacteraceae bacterium]|jgi:glycogen debranching enzyme|nr:amylo-alpha-1,6-glucosidase [Bryobacteraceae bacterium]